MEEISTIGIDIAKNVFQVHGIIERGEVVERRQLKRRQVLSFFARLPDVIPGKVMAVDVVNLNSATTVNGQEVTITTGDGVKVDDAKIIRTDILAKNGVIHTIDSVIMPN